MAATARMLAANNRMRLVFTFVFTSQLARAQEDLSALLRRSRHESPPASAMPLHTNQSGAMLTPIANQCQTEFVRERRTSHRMGRPVTSGSPASFERVWRPKRYFMLTVLMVTFL